jgi:hypothetical protein
VQFGIPAGKHSLSALPQTLSRRLHASMAARMAPTQTIGRSPGLKEAFQTNVAVRTRFFDDFLRSVCVGSCQRGGTAMR